MIAKFSPRRIITSMVIISSLLVGLVPSRAVLAVDGLPGTPSFGYGARLDLQGQGIRQAVDLAAGMNFSWLMVEFDWTYYWPDPNSQPKWTQLDTVAKLAHEKNITLGISLFNPPAWAVTAQGPDPEKTSRLVVEIAERYPEIILAIELFPGINTVAGWSANPSPSDFIILLQSVSEALSAAHQNIQLITTLSPVLPGRISGDIPDQEFLNNLYINGWKTENSILGVYYSQITGNVLQSSMSDGLLVLRHYEELRSVLIQNHDEQRLIWITGFSWPDELISDDSLFTKQADWLYQAFRLLTAQLYIGAAFFEQINPNSTSIGTSSLLQPDGTLHPACPLISQLTNPTNIIIPDPDYKDLFLSYMYKNITK